MIRLFESDTIHFTNNGLHVLNNIKNANSDEVLNNLYSSEFEVVYDERGKWKEVINGRIIYADNQPFRIYKTKKNLRSLTVYTRHVFWDLLNNEVRDIRPTNQNGMGAMNDVLGATNYPHPFTAFSDIETLNTQYYINKNPVECLIGKDSLITRWGGELKLDNWRINILSQRGQDNGVSIAYRKNMLNIDVEEDHDTLITRMRPNGRDGLELPEVYIDSPYISNYPFPIVREVEFDIGIDEENGITEAMAIEQLRAAAKQYYIDTKCDIPLTNIKVDMALLENTEEYKSFQNLVRVNLGDIVTCKHMDLGINHKAKVIRIKKDLLTGKNAEVELGSFKQNLSSAFTKIENAFKDMSEVIANNKTSLQKAIDNATELLTTAMGGYVLKRNGEILIMDTEDPATATKVWRWNINGLGYSSSGISGPYGLAMTMDGQIVADFITTGILDASLIKTGMLKSANYEEANGVVTQGTKIDMNNGDIHTENLEVNGALTQRDLDSKLKSISLEHNEVRLYDWETTGEHIGSLGATSDSAGNDVTIWAKQGHKVVLGIENPSTNKITPILTLSELLLNLFADSNFNYHRLNDANLYWKMADSDYARIIPMNSGTDKGSLEIATADNGDEPINVRQYTGQFENVVNTLTLLDGSGNTWIPKKLYIDGWQALDTTNIKHSSIVLTTDWQFFAFNSVFEGSPSVVITPNTSNTGAIPGKIRNVTKNGFEACIGGTGASASMFDYIAFAW